MCRVCPSWLSFILYNPVRKALTDREKVLEESGISSGSVVLEIGAGNGFFTEVLAKKARKVYAVELQEGMIRKLKKRIGSAVERVEIIRGDIAGLKVGEEVADVCLMYYSLHEVGDKTAAARNICSAMKQDGILSIYEPALEVSKTDMEKTTRLFEELGFEKERAKDGTFTRFARLRKVQKFCRTW